VVVITNLEVLTPVTTGDGDKAKGEYSFEGQAPNLTGLTIRGWYSDGHIVNFTNAQVKSNFKTIPAILGEAQINTATAAATTPAPTVIYIYHSSAPTVLTPITLPGVDALRAIGRGTSNDGNPSATAESLKKGVWGVTDGVYLDGTYNDKEFFEDGPAPVITTGPILVQYQGLIATGSTYVKNHAPTPLSPAAYVATLPITADHLFVDYKGDFLGSSPTSAFSYGVNAGVDVANGVINVLVSRGTTHGGPSNRSIYVAVPFDRSNFHYVRDIEVTGFTFASEDADGKKDWPFLIQSDLLGKNEAWWNEKLISSKIKLNVYYDNSTTVNPRDDTFFQRSVSLGVGGIMNWRALAPGVTAKPNVSDTDGEDFGQITIGYYTSLPLAAGRTPIKKGDFSNAVVYKLPIATYVEGSAEMRLKKNAVPARDLVFFVDSVANQTAAGRSITATQLKALQESYQYVGEFDLDGTRVKKELIPSSEWKANWFSPAFVTSEIDEAFEVTFSPPRAEVVNGNYAMFAGEEASFTIKLYPRDYDLK
jgi:hypothetical protein